MQAWLDTLIAQTSWMQEVPRGFIYTAGMLGAFALCYTSCLRALPPAAPVDARTQARS